MKARVAILLSGRGSNFLALQAAIARGAIPAEIVLVLSNRKSAAGLRSAAELGLPTLCLPHGEAPSREAHDERVVAALAAAAAEWICLAGYMRLLSPVFVRAFPRRILNVHPSLLPAFPGLHAQRQALEHGVRVSGCTVHLVDEELDHGPIVEQRAVPVRSGDTEETLADRILVQEHRAYPEALRRLLTRRWTIVGRRVVFARSRSAG
ncbi:MAG: phosphoribosylglycinamide formyltransferase [Acidobacteriota bacterium]|nr:phosphoribosylglycinamide formyltransferase [Acidobacteriota bacterium]MDH3523057.1 phosphoribosylglycinamide formyltransferase [Acidobacteriota bacterium]